MLLRPREQELLLRAVVLLRPREEELLLRAVP